MAVVVQKYGGSSVSSLEKIKAVAHRIVKTRAEGKDVVVVVSAMGKMTDELLEMARKISAEPGRRELDMLLSVGERIAMSLLSMAINDLGCRAISFTGSQSGIITDTRHVDARIIEVRPIRIASALEQGNVVIVAGYQGVSLEKEVTTLGRGGSDTTSIALAAALDAEYCEICSDVDGVYSADPREVPTARRLPAISYDAMLELSHAGAKVLNAEAVAYAQRHRIRIHATATFKSNGYTLISVDVPPEDRIVAVTSERDLVGVCLEPFSGDAVVGDLLEWLAERGIAPRMVHVTGHGSDRRAAVWFPGLNVPDLDGLSQEGDARFGELFQLRNGFGSVTLVGWGLCENPMMLCRAIRAVGGDVRDVYHSHRGMTLIVPRDELSVALKKLHEAVVVLGGKNENRTWCRQAGLASEAKSMREHTCSNM